MLALASSRAVPVSTFVNLPSSSHRRLNCLTWSNSSRSARISLSASAREKGVAEGRVGAGVELGRREVRVRDDVGVGVGAIVTLIGGISVGVNVGVGVVSLLF